MTNEQLWSSFDVSKSTSTVLSPLAHVELVERLKRAGIKVTGLEEDEATSDQTEA